MRIKNNIYINTLKNLINLINLKILADLKTDKKLTRKSVKIVIIKITKSNLLFK